MYTLYLYFLGLSFRSTAKALDQFMEKRCDVADWFRVCMVMGSYRNMLVAESFLRSLIKVHGKHTAYSDGGTWDPEACSYLGLKHLLHSPLEKSIIEITIEYFKDRTEIFDDYCPCKHKIKYELSHVHNWLSLFVFMHNANILHIKFMSPIRIMSGE